MDVKTIPNHDTAKKRSKWSLYLVLAVCAAPLMASYLTYYVIKPTSRSNYGTLLNPRLYPMPTLHGTLVGGEPRELSAYQGKWVMLQVSASDCQAACQQGLVNMRQLRLMQGKDMNRIERVVLIIDQQPMSTMLLKEYDGADFLRADKKAVMAWLPADMGQSIEDRLYLIDPLGNLIMRYPVDADPNKVKKDLTKLLKASAIG